jgi:UDP-N-acetylmuramate dehydrogenase
MIGSGSNIVWGDAGFQGLVMVNRIPGFEIQELDPEASFIHAGSGEVWDSVVERTVAKGLSGIEMLSRIPGTVGAAPMQNIGAYGQQLSDVLVTLEVYDAQAKQFLNMHGSDCAFGYRTSRFKTTDKGRFFITGITMRLNRGGMAKPPYYRDVQAYIDNNHVTDITLQKLREIVSEIRAKKLPDPSTIPSNGSFFQNPIIEREQFDRLVADHPEIEQNPPGWSQPPRWFQDDGRVKLSAGWLLDNCGFKDYHDADTGMATWKFQSLVIVNEHAKNTKDLLQFKAILVGAVQQKFGITLVQEPELIDS